MEAFRQGRLAFVEIVDTVARVLTRHDVRSSVDPARPHRGRRARRRRLGQVRHRRRSGGTAPHDRARLHRGRPAVRGRARRLGGPARGGPPDPRQAVQRQGHPVLRRVRPHAVVHPARRDGVRRQGDPARRLLQARRHGAAGAGPARGHREEPQHRHVRAARQRRARLGVRARHRGGPRPAVLRQAVVEARDHHGLGGGDQPRARVPALRGRVHGPRRPGGDHHHLAGLAVRDRGHQGQSQPAATCLHITTTRSRAAKAAGFLPGDRIRVVQRDDHEVVRAGAQGDPRQRRPTPPPSSWSGTASS